MIISILPDLATLMIDLTSWLDTSWLDTSWLNTSWLNTSWLNTLQPSHWHLPVDLAALGDKELKVDLAGDVQRSFNNFVKTGQVWAFLIGIIFGYFVKTFTSFG